MPSSCAAIDDESLLDEEDDTPPLHVIVPAAGQPLPRTRAPRSIFEVGTASGIRSMLGDSFSSDAAERPTRFSVCVRDGGTTRCVGGQYPANRWTAEREAQERARRARQKPPRPVKKARTRGKKLAELIAFKFDD